MQAMFAQHQGGSWKPADHLVAAIRANPPGQSRLHIAGNHVAGTEPQTAVGPPAAEQIAVWRVDFRIMRYGKR